MDAEQVLGQLEVSLTLHCFCGWSWEVFGPATLEKAQKHVKSHLREGL